MPKKKIVFLTNSPVPYQLGLFGELAKKNPVKMLLAAGGNGGQNVVWKLDVPPWAKVLNGVGIFAKWREICLLLKAEEVAYVVLGGYKLDYSWLVLFWAKMHKVPVYYWMERPQPHVGLKEKLRNFVMGLFLRMGDGVWGIDADAVALYSKYNKNVAWQPYAIVGYGPPEKRAYKKPLKCLYIGQFIERKGLDILFEAFADFDATDVGLTFAGGGPLKDKVDLFCKEKGHVNAGFVQPADLPTLLATHDVFVFPSRYDGWGVVVNEAMAAGMPVLTTHRVGACDLVDENCGAVLGFEAADFKMKIQAYMDDKVLLARHADAAYERWEKSGACTVQAVDFLVRQDKR